MATKSILKNSSIKDNLSAKRLATALENTSERRDSQVEIKHAVSEASREEIRYIFNRES